MTDEANRYVYYSFPATPQRSASTVRHTSPNPDLFHTPLSSPTAIREAEMAPSPVLNRGASGQHKTPTKISKKPAPLSATKFGQDGKQSKPSTPTTPKPPKDADEITKQTKQPLDDAKSQSPDLKKSSKDVNKQTENVKKSLKDDKNKAQDATPNKKGKVGLDQVSSNTADDNDEPLKKVQQTGKEATEGLKDVAPEPIKDESDLDDAGDTVGGAADQAEDTTDQAAEHVEDIADDVTEKAGAIGESADDTNDDQSQSMDSSPEAPIKDNKLSKTAKDTPSTGKKQGQKLKNSVEDKGKADPEEGQKTGQKIKGTAKDAAKSATKAGQKVSETTKDAVDPQEGADREDDKQDDEEQQAGEDEEDEAEENENKINLQSDDADDETQKVNGEANGIQDDTNDAGEQMKDAAEDVGEQAKDAGEKAGEDAGEEAQAGAEDAEEKANDAAEDAGEKPPMPEGLPVDLNVLNGLEVQADGTVFDQNGNAIGRLVEGDAEDLEGYPIGDDGEILDDDGDLVGRVELSPDEIKRQLQKAREDGKDLPDGVDEYLEGLDQEGKEGEDDDEEEEGPTLPGLQILEGLTCQVDGLVYDDDGNTVGKVVEGDPQELQHAKLNANGEFVDDEDNVIGRAEIHEEAAELVEKGIYKAADIGDEAEDQDENQADDQGEAGDDDDVQDAVEGAQGDAQDAAEGIEDELPGIEALQGKELNEIGEVVDDSGDVLAKIEDEELKKKIEDGEIDPEDLHIDESGQVVDKDGNVLSSTELVDGAAEKLAGIAPSYDMRILEGRKVNKKGKILDDDGEEIGQLVEGDPAQCTGKKCNAKGEVLDKQDKVIGKVKVSEGEAAQTATKELLEELGESDDAAADDKPGLDILEGLKVNKKGKILDEDGELIGELVDGDPAECAGKKCNAEGEVLDKEGNVIGHVQTLAPETAEEVEDQPAEDQPEEDEQQQQDGEEADDEGLPPLSILEGYKVNKSGKIIDDNGAIIGELVEGDAKKLSKQGITCDAEGQFWDNKGHVIGRAKTLPQEEAEEEAPFAGLEGLKVIEDGWVADGEGNRVGRVTDGDAKKLIGRAVDEDGDVLDKKGSVVGHAERYSEEESPEEAPADLSFLEGKTVNKAGYVLGDEGVPVARLVEGNPKEIGGRKLDSEGQIWNDSGKVIGKVELIPEEERESKPEGPFAGLENLKVIEGGKVADGEGNVVGEIVEGNAKRLVGLSVDEDGDIVDRYGSVKGHAEPLPEEEEQQEDNSILANKVLNKSGYVVDESGIPFGRLVEGNVKELAGRRCDEDGAIHGDTGKIVGRCEVIPENERVSRPEGPFAGLEGLRVVKGGKVEDSDGNVVGEIVEGNAKRLVGMAVDEDGDIIDKFGNVKGHADPWEEPEEEATDLSRLAGCTINKSGNAVDGSGTIIGHVVEGETKKMIGKKVDGQGQIWDNAGNVVGRCELSQGEDTSPEGPFAGFDDLRIKKDGTIVTASDDIVGRIIDGDIKKLVGHKVDEEGDIVDKNGNTIGKAERWEPEEKERHANPMSGMHVNKEGEVRDDKGDLVGKLTEGNLGHCVGQEIDDNGNVVDQDGNKIGEVTLLENIAEDYEGPSEEELEEARKRDEERKIAEKMAGICTQTLERMQPICKQISEYMEKADRTPKEELDEEELVNQVKPLIEEGGRVLQECNGSLRGLDPDGHIAAQAKGRAGTNEATPEEYRLAETLKELTSTVVTTIDNAKKKLNDMPHAKKKLNPLWSLLTQPLFQILAAVGLLLAGVLGLVGQLLNGLGLGGLVNGLLGGLGIDKLLESFGLGGGKKKKGGKGSAISNLPVIGGLLGGK